MAEIHPAVATVLAKMPVDPVDSRDDETSEDVYLRAARAYDRRDDPAELEPRRSPRVLGDHPPFRAAIDEARAPLLADVGLLKAAADECMRQRDEVVAAELRAVDLAQRAVGLLVRMHDDDDCLSSPDGGRCVGHGYEWPCANAESAKLIEEASRG